MSEDPVSGIYLFYAPRRRDRGWVTNLGPDSGIEIIQRHHRFVCAPPSIHVTTGRVYRWWRGTRAAEWPTPGELPILPVGWARYLRSQRPYALPSVATSLEAAAWYGRVSDGAMCEAMKTATEKGCAEIRSASAYGGLHDTMTRVTTFLCRSAAEGHRGLARALDDVEGAFLSSSRSRGLSGEWERAVSGAQAQAARWRQSRTDPCVELLRIGTPRRAR
jgi:hypothetical protein